MWAIRKDAGLWNLHLIRVHLYPLYSPLQMAPSNKSDVISTGALGSVFANSFRCRSCHIWGEDNFTIMSIFTTILMIYWYRISEIHRGRCCNSLKRWHSQISLFPVLTSSPILELIWKFCLSDETCHSGEYCREYLWCHLFMLTIRHFCGNGKTGKVTKIKRCTTGQNDTKAWLVPADVMSLWSYGAICKGENGDRPGPINGKELWWHHCVQWPMRSINGS